MSGNTTTSKFTRFMRNNAALLLIIFCVVAITTVVILSTLSENSNPVVVNPDDGKQTDVPVEPTPKTVIVKTYFSAPLQYEKVTMEYTDKENVLFVFNKTLGSWQTHNAVDLSASEGADVVAMFDGTVVDVSESYGMGNSVTVDHGDGVVATYSSLGNVSVTNGAEVKKGDKLGDVSATASYEFSDGAHLHLEVRENGTTVNPMPYVNGEVYREHEEIQ